LSNNYNRAVIATVVSISLRVFLEPVSVKVLEPGLCSLVETLRDTDMKRSRGIQGALSEVIMGMGPHSTVMNILS
jgi:hypothetical protein